MYKKFFKTDNFEFSIDDVLKTAWLAGKAIIEIYEKDFNVEYKKDESPLTEADKKSHFIITKELQKYNLPILSEEGKNISYDDRKNWDLFWMVDPIDGTKEFIKKNGEFTINIALIYKNNPIFGIVYAPAIDEIYFSDENKSFKAYLTIDKFELSNVKQLPINRNDNKLIIVASKSHLNDETKKFIEDIKTDKEKEFMSKGSSLKLCMVAEGKADIYPRIAPTMEWDTAAADAIVRKAGKMTFIYNEYFSINSIESMDSIKTIVYNKEHLLNPYFLVK
jgi:3'(2'), 5'-bisphosphate nucleotidase